MVEVIFQEKGAPIYNKILFFIIPFLKKVASKCQESKGKEIGFRNKFHKSLNDTCFILPLFLLRILFS